MKRRSFLKSAAATALSIQIVPRHVLGGDGIAAPSERLNIASIGVGGMGGNDIGSLSNGPINMVGLCDVSEGNLAKAAGRFPGAKTFNDFRKLLDALDKRIDAVSVSTPDHMHAPITMSAIHRGKHVYCQKPMTHSLYEARQIAAAAKKANVVTQMGIQIHSSIEYRMATMLIQAGAIGKIKEVHSWSDRPGWPQGGSRPQGSDPIPADLDWDLWLGVAAERPFAAGVYVPFKWRGFLDFGCGALGDMGCHIIDPPFTALALTSPISVTAEGPGCTAEMFPTWETIRYEFPGTQYTADKTVTLSWYDGKRPGANKPAESLVPLGKGQRLPDNGSIFIGEDGSMLLPHIGGPQLLPREKFLTYKHPKLKGQDHYVQWVNACLGKDKASANFDFAGPLTETVLLGVLAARYPGKRLQWDTTSLRVTNLPEANEHVRVAYRKGWEVEGLQNGMPKHEFGELAALVTAVLWTLSALAWTSAGQRVGALAVSFLRLVLAIPLYLLVLYAAGGMNLLLSADLRTWETLGFSGFLGFFVSDLCLFKAFLVIGPRLSLLVTSLTPPMTVVMSWAFRGGGGFGTRSWIGMGVTLAGVLWVVLERRAGDGHPHTLRQLRYGLALALAATAVQAAGTVLAKVGTTQFPPPDSSLVLGAAASALIRVVGAVVGYVILVTLLGRWPAMAAAVKQRREVGIMAGGTIVGPCLGVTTYMMALAGCHEGEVTTILATIPVMILPFSIYLYGERVSPRALGGALIATAGVALLMWPG